MPEITTAGLADIPALCELLTLLFTQEEDFMPAPAKQAEGLREIIERPETGHILVLRDAAKILGMVNLLYTVSTAMGGKVALLEDMIIAPQHCNEGHGTRLLQSAIEHAQSQGCLRITLLTGRANDAAIRFYRRNGFAFSSMIPLRLEL
jgi:GNAT superfamily N-acetyltransferase